IPIAVAILVLIFLHKRHMKKQALEDLNDKHKSLDFGLDEAPAAGRPGTRKGVPEMTVTEADKSVRSGGRGMSMDMEHSPYLLPQGAPSRDSFHSISRSTLADSIDPYRPVTFVKDDAMSIRSPRSNFDNASTYSKTSVTNDRNPLLRNAQRMSRGYPTRSPSMSPEDRTIPEIQFPEAAQHKPPPSPSIQTPPSLTPGEPDIFQDNYFENSADKKRASMHQPVSAVKPAARKPAPLRLDSMSATVHNPKTESMISDTSDYGEGFKVTPPSPGREKGPVIQETIAPMEAPSTPPAPANTGLAVTGNNQRISMSLRPLPSDDPEENPEQRANRIRSFYKEYFDDSKPEPAGATYGETDAYGNTELEGAVFDPDKGHFVVAGKPFAEPVTRRAMTPPPRAPPRFQRPRGYSSGGTDRSMPPPRNFSAMSGASSMTPPRAFSGMSHRPGFGPPPPKKPLPPPSSLNSLPTPAKLKEDSHIFNPIDFAPPPTFRDMQAGRRPDSPMGVERPYSPSVRPHTPLHSAFEELPAMPSPHLLRKSGTFTALDFAPPPKFKDVDTGSDAASIRSNGSGLSSAQIHAVRAGAYRVSRLPKDMVGTKDDFTEQLKPSWDLRAK
ncbi:hypothetical protein K490DRAFT_44889, partial [Saccharata proteae CBS 121410]